MQLSPLLGAGLAVALIPVLTANPAAAPASQGGGNQAPVCVIEGGDITVTATGPTVTLDLDGCASFDPDGQALSYKWVACAGVGFSTPDQCATQLTVDVQQISLPFTCGVRLVVSDGVAESNSACRIFVTILPPEQPDLDIRPGCCPNDIKPWKVSTWDVATPFEGQGCECHKLTKDGIPDLYLKFSTPWMVSDFKLYKEKDKTQVPLVLTGKLVNGASFEVEDCIRVIGGCK